MKRVLWILSLALLASACTVKELAEATASIIYPSKVTARIDDNQPSSDTKAYVDANLKVLWESDDRITLFNKYTYNKEYRFTGSTGANSGVFEEVSSSGVLVGNALDNVYAVYPYNSLTEISNSGVIAMDLPAEQNYKVDSFGRGANTMISATSNTELLFKNLCGYLILKLYGDGVSVSSISIQGNNGEVLAGKADVTATVGSTPTLSFRGSGTSTTLTLTCETPVALGSSAADATVFWLVVPPITFTQGFTLTVTDSDNNTFTKSTSNSTTISRNSTYRMAALEVVPDMPQPKNVIYYTSKNEVIVTPNNTGAFGANIVNNIYENGKGIITFDGNVTSIGQNAFKNCYGLTSLSVPAGVLSIGVDAFRSCTSLTSINIPEGVTSIGNYAFFNTSLNTISLPESVTNIGGNAFVGCNFTSINIPSGVTVIKTQTFRNCSLTSIIIPEGVTAIQEQAFANCSSLSSVSLPESLKTMYDSFRGCSALTSISIPANVTSMGQYTFYLCSQLTSINIPAGVTKIEQHVFDGCSSLTSISIPASVTKIEQYAFNGCSSLSSVSIPEGVTSIGNNAFNGCESLISVVVNASTPPTGGTSMFSGSYPIYVPSNAVDTYKAAEYWSDYVARIQAIPAN